MESFREKCPESGGRIVRGYVEAVRQYIVKLTGKNHTDADKLLSDLSFRAEDIKTLFEDQQNFYTATSPRDKETIKDWRRRQPEPTPEIPPPRPPLPPVQLQKTEQYLEMEKREQSLSAECDKLPIEALKIRIKNAKETGPEYDVRTMERVLARKERELADRDWNERVGEEQGD